VSRAIAGTGRRRRYPSAVPSPDLVDTTACPDLSFGRFAAVTASLLSGAARRTAARRQH